MKIQKIYDKYKIMPQLQLHQMRVAGVASIICDNFQKEIDKESVVSAALLHDMGNIIKFKLDLYPENLKPQGLEYWEGVKNDFIKKYGDNEHEATYKICKELGIIDSVYELINAFGFSKSDINYKDKSYEKKICVYSDHRVTPFGVTSQEERLNEGRKRYVKNNNIKHDAYDKKRFDYLADYSRKIEQQIFYHCKISPEDITDREVMHLLPEIRQYNVKISQ